MSEWGEMPADDFAELVEDVKAHGVRQPVTIYEGKVLDGWHRYRAARSAGVDCPMEDFTGDDPVAFVTSLNAHRRHYTTAKQRAKYLLKARGWAEVGINQHPDPERVPQGDRPPPPTTAEVAKEANTSPATVERAKAEIRKERGEVKPKPTKPTKPKAKPAAASALEKVRKARDQARAEAKQLRAEHRAKVKELREKHRAKVKKHRAEVEFLREKISYLSPTGDALKDLNAEHRAEEKELKAEHRAEVKQLRAEVKELKAENRNLQKAATEGENRNLQKAATEGGAA